MTPANKESGVAVMEGRLDSLRFGLLFAVTWSCLALLPDFLAPGWDARLVFSALFFNFCVGLLAGVPAGLAFALFVPGGNPLGTALSLLRWFWAWARRPDPVAAERTAALLFGGAVTLGLHVLLSLPLLERAAVEVARSENQALISYFIVAGLALGLLPVAAALVLLARLGLGLLRRHLGLALVGTRPLWSLTLVAFGGLAFCLWFVLNNLESVRLSPWQTPTQWLLMGLVSLVVVAALEYLTFARRLGKPMTILASVAILATGLSAALLPLQDQQARAQFQSGRASALAYGLLGSLLDSDGDGFMSAFAGGDCDPLDGDVNPAAIDVPDNGVDEDCSGRDESASVLSAARWDFPLDGLKEGLRRGLPVIIITNDAMSANHVGFLGYKRPVSPNLDKLAKGCVRFHQAFSQGPSTRISLPSFFTSMFDTQTEFQPVGKNPHPFSPNNLTMAEVFSQNGYETVAVVPKWYFTSMWKGILQGFDEVDERAIKHYNEKKRKTHNARFVTKYALEQLRKDREKPLFMWVHYYDVHFPYRQPQGTKVFGPDRQDKFDAAMLFWDKESQPLFKEIKRRFGKDGYILVVTSDHGSSFDERHPKFANGYDLYTSTLHIPMLWCGPFFQPGDVKDTPVSLMDILPTFTNLLGLQGSFSFEGTSLVPLLAGKTGAFQGRHIFHQFFLSEKAIKGKDPLQQAAVRSGTHNYIWNRLQDTRELYDFRKDPWETRDLCQDKPRLAAEMHARLQAWLYRVHKRYNPALKGRQGGPAAAGEEGAEAHGDYGLESHSQGLDEEGSSP